MDPRENRSPDPRRVRRRIAVIALLAVLGATVYGDNRGLSPSGVASSVTGALRIGECLGRAASGFSRIVGDAATLGVLSGTVLSPMDPRLRHSILASVEGIREVCTSRPADPPVARCANRNLPAKKPVRCTRA
ncbi:MAG TPA: hypothetical protein VFS34_01350 [Thermoanaerobaculia bacterium]|nr:hypothetical protein [Thermoanaerobaculia bacterium]